MSVAPSLVGLLGPALSSCDNRVTATTDKYRAPPTDLAAWLTCSSRSLAREDLKSLNSSFCTARNSLNRVVTETFLPQKKE